MTAIQQNKERKLTLSSSHTDSAVTTKCTRNAHHIKDVKIVIKNQTIKTIQMRVQLPPAPPNLVGQ